MSVFDCLKNFCAVNFPAAYEILYRIRHKIYLEDFGEAVYVHSRDFTDYVRLKKSNDFALKVPLDFDYPPVNFKVAAVVHIFYPELAAEIKNFLMNIPCAADVYISTTDADKKSVIENVFADFDKGNVTIKIFPNRGRDIAPAFVGFRDIYGDYDACVHIHTKKSPHDENRLANWRDHLYKNLLGSPEVVSDILKILANDKVGLVFPQYYAPMRVLINWGENYLATKNFLRGLGIEIDNRHLIEFPAGSMFWFKPKALAPLLENVLTIEDFPVESGQVDGTLAHAIERAFLFIVEASGFTWIKVDGDGLKSSAQAELDKNILRAWHSVLKKY